MRFSLDVIFCLFLLLITNGQRVKHGDDASLDCSTNDKDLVEYVWWKFKNHSIYVDILHYIYGNITKEPLFENIIYSEENFKNGNYSITLRSVTFEHVGQYWCIIQKNGSPATLKQKINLEVVDWKQSVTLPTAGTLILNLHTNGSVQVHFWSNGTKHSVCEMKLHVLNCELQERYKNRSKMENGTLIIHHVMPDESGLYMVQDHLGHNISTVTVAVPDQKGVGPNSTSESHAGDNGHQQTILVVAPVISVLLLLSLLVGIGVFLRKRRRRRSRNRTERADEGDVAVPLQQVHEGHH